MNLHQVLKLFWKYKAAFPTIFAAEHGLNCMAFRQPHVKQASPVWSGYSHLIAGAWHTPWMSAGFVRFSKNEQMHAADMGRLQSKCNRLRLGLLVTCSITVTNKQNHNAIDYDYIESNHDYNRDFILSSDILRKKTHPFAWFDVRIFQAIRIWTNAINNITNHEGVGTEKNKKWHKLFDQIFVQSRVNKHFKY